MRNIFLLLFLISQTLSFSQQLSSKKFTVLTNNIEINTEGLDEIVLETSEDDFVSIFLDEENSFAHHIITSEKNGILSIDFQPEINQKEPVFRKFITERLHRASVKIKIPKNKNLTFLGDEVDVISKSYQGNLSVFIDKGSLSFNTLKGNLQLHLYSGNVFLTTSEGKINIDSANGSINVNNVLESNPYQKTLTNSLRNLTIKSKKANIVLTSK
ncbi:MULTISPECIES: hypothetical protein [Tenacibaculum]|uniref:hypothetical protein n=1 Tax=Tenacibaculum TaxID=104267 RepID=UPI001F0AC4BA|nr:MULTISPECIES: hypothetical protein [Tenacibaculum]MCH3881121.1 hypothetical protein [Tenacibaculum aquimarinum]MCH3884014.1 hypothetical protein [Tenacibaculum aquimarinum]MDO6599279.1 hypothetical protein [Tenacibaculum sp. 1_MG-2023]